MKRKKSLKCSITNYKKAILKKFKTGNFNPDRSEPMTKAEKELREKLRKTAKEAGCPEEKLDEYVQMAIDEVNKGIQKIIQEIKK